MLRIALLSTTGYVLHLPRLLGNVLGVFTIGPCGWKARKMDCHGVFVGYSVIYCSAVLAIFAMGLITYVAAGRSITDVWRRLKYDDVQSIKRPFQEMFGLNVHYTFFDLTKNNTSKDVSYEFNGKRNALSVNFFIKGMCSGKLTNLFIQNDAKYPKYTSS